jgi:CopG family nickel-responsive transcriptional regulator
MTRIERIGISLEKELLANFDKLIKKKGFPNRSEAIRDLIRQQLGEQKLQNPDARAVAAVCLVYDHHATNLMEKLTELQHSKLLQTVCSTHVHLDHHDCLELIVLKGKIEEINKTAENLISIKGVKLGKINLIAAD